MIGGGHNGLVASFYLARAGLAVVLVERREFVGGACATEELFEGYQFSSCSYLAWMLQRKVVDDMELRRHGFSYHSIDPMAFHAYPDGSHFFSWSDEARTQAELARLSEHDSQAYPAWNRFWTRASGLVNHFMLVPPPTLDDLRAHAREIGEEALLDELLRSSIAEICDNYFDDPRIPPAMVQVEEVGDPWTPGGAWPEAYFHANTFTEMGYAVVVGGMGAITQAMARSAVSRGVQIRTGAEVDQILIEDGSARGVRLGSGEEIRSRIVISNADPKRTYLHMVPSDALSQEFRLRVEGLSTATSYLKFHSVMDRLPDISGYIGREAEPNEVSHIHIAPSLEHYRRAHQEAMRGEPANEPIVSLQIPTVYDKTLTRQSGHVVSIWALYAPPKLAESDWEAQRASTGEALIDYVTEYIPNFRKDLREWRLFTPYDLEKRVGLTDGNIRHLDMIASQFMGDRPISGAGYGSPIGGLFLCGAGTHPGGEVTGAPGHNCAHAILDLGLQKPEHR